MIALLDLAAPRALSFSVFYFVPVAWAAWFAGRRPALLIVVLTTVVWGAMDLAGGLIAKDPVIAVGNEASRFGLFVVAWALLSEVRETSFERQRLALTDPLTGAANIRVMDDDIAREIERLQRFGRPFALAYLDLDQFKQVNDLLGHKAGNEVLCDAAVLLVERARVLDTVARIGGDEFAILMPETDEAAVTTVLERMVTELAEVMQRDAPSIRGTGASIGAVVFTSSPRSVDHALSLADTLMYGVKRAGGGSVAVRVYNGE